MTSIETDDRNIRVLLNLCGDERLDHGGDRQFRNIDFLRARGLIHYG